MSTREIMLKQIEKMKEHHKYRLSKFIDMQKEKADRCKIVLNWKGY